MRKARKKIQNCEAHFLESDVIYNEKIHQHPFMGHSIEDPCDLSFESFIDISKNSKRGIKLDFKTHESLEPCLKHLKKLQNEIKMPVILNADVFQGVNCDKTLIDSNYFVQICKEYFPRGILSLGWTTKPCSTTKYTLENVQEASNLYKMFNLQDNVHFAIRLSWSTRSIEELIHLYELTKCSFTLWSHKTDTLSSVESILLFRHFFPHNKIYYDLADENIFLITNQLALECPPGVPIAMCFADPCAMAATKGCAAYPKAICKSNFCGGCNAEWFFNGTKVDCNLKEKADKLKLSCLFPVNCFVEPCRFATCPTHPNAVCVNNYCDGCNAFFYENGVRVTC
ncbi:unnamed protein product [Brachionus calyciflorus]|uniref:Menorin-like domain-containing protein n=1 Tax=Brachionus calyciflorus TaxID=104777 RepID=A0A813RD25_9BILA|nr:unnamed protein product [Brachionus calyciflorus]